MLNCDYSTLVSPMYLWSIENCFFEFKNLKAFKRTLLLILNNSQTEDKLVNIYSLFSNDFRKALTIKRKCDTFL